MFSYVKRDPDICQKRHQMQRLHDVGAPSNKVSSSPTRCCVSWSRREGRDAAHTHETHIYTSWPKRTHTYVLQTIGIKCIRIYAGKWRGSVCFLPARQARFIYTIIYTCHGGGHTTYGCGKMTGQCRVSTWSCGAHRTSLHLMSLLTGIRVSFYMWDCVFRPLHLMSCVNQIWSLCNWCRVSTWSSGGHRFLQCKTPKRESVLHCKETVHH